MNREDIEFVLRGLGSDRIGHTHDHIMTSCPLAKWTHPHGTDSNPSMGVLESEGMSPVNCFTCGYRGGLLGLVNEVERYRAAEGNGDKELTSLLTDFIRDAETKEFVERPDLKEIEMPLELMQNLNKYHPYMQSRGIKEETAKKWLLGWWDFSVPMVGEYKAENNERIIYPVISKKGDIKGFQCRLIDSSVDAPKYKNYPQGVSKSAYLYGEHLVKDREKLLILESQNGTVKVNQLLEENGITNILALGLMGSKPSDAQVDKMVMWGKEVIICLDNDAAGRTGTTELIKKLRYRSCMLSIIPYPPDSEGKDAEDLGEGLLDLLDKRLYYIEYQLRKSLSFN